MKVHKGTGQHRFTIEHEGFHYFVVHDFPGVVVWKQDKIVAIHKSSSDFELDFKRMPLKVWKTIKILLSTI